MHLNTFKWNIPLFGIISEISSSLIRTRNSKGNSYSKKLTRDNLETAGGVGTVRNSYPLPKIHNKCRLLEQSSSAWTKERKHCPSLQKCSLSSDDSLFAIKTEWRMRVILARMPPFLGMPPSCILNSDLIRTFQLRIESRQYRAGRSSEGNDNMVVGSIGDRSLPIPINARIEPIPQDRCGLLCHMGIRHPRDELKVDEIRVLLGKNLCLRVQ